MRPIEVAAGLGAPGLFVVAGLGVTAFVPELRRLPWLRRLAFAYLLGVAWTDGVLYALSYLFDAPIRSPLIVAVVAAPFAASLLLPRRASRPLEKRKGRRDVLWLATVVLTSLVCLAVLAEALTNPVKDFDGRMTWVTQARYIRAEGSVLPRVLRGQQWFITHPDYPPLLPLAQVAVLEVFRGREDSFLFRTIYAAMLPALLIVVYEGARRRAGARPAMLASLSVALLPFLAFEREGGASGTYSDVPLAAFYGGALVLLLLRGTVASGAAAGIVLAAMVFTKKEGTLLAVALLIAGLFSGRWKASHSARRRREVARLTVAALIAGAAVLLVARWSEAVKDRGDEDYFVQLRDASPQQLVSGVKHVFATHGQIIVREMLDTHQWSLLWWVAPLILAMSAQGWRRKRSWPLLAALTMPLLFAMSAYVFNPSDTEFVQVTWNRFVVQAVVPFFLLFAEALKAALRTGRPLRAARPKENHKI